MYMPYIDPKNQIFSVNMYWCISIIPVVTQVSDKAELFLTQTCRTSYMLLIGCAMCVDVLYTLNMHMQLYV